MKYDPTDALDTKRWLSIDESKRVVLVEKFHERAGIKLPNKRIHAAIHTAVENQMALGEDFPTEETLNRLMGEGLDRHDALHAIGSVLSEHLYSLLKGESAGGFDEKTYRRDLEGLTAESWQQGNRVE